MSSEPNTLVHDKYLTITHRGRYSLPEMFKLIDFVKEAAERAGRDKVLIDGRYMMGLMTETDRFLGGKRMADVFGSKLQVAILMRPGLVTKLGEIAAVNRGARLLVTSDEDEALTWLLR